MQKDPRVIQEKFRELFKLLHQCQEVKQKSEQILSEVTKTQKHLHNRSKISPALRTKLCNNYHEAIQSTDDEAEALSKALSVIHEIRAINNERRLASKKTARPKETMRTNALMTMLRMSGRTIPLWIGKPDERPPPLCAAVPAEPTHIAKTGDLVAALVEVDSNGTWILAEVNYFDPITSTYEVEDIDISEKKMHVMSQENIFPLPLMRAHPEMNPEAIFQKGTLVLALYPGCTCFYAGVVSEPPSKPNEDYRILFEDQSRDSGYLPPLNVCQRYVINYRPSQVQASESHITEE